MFSRSWILYILCILCTLCIPFILCIPCILCIHGILCILCILCIPCCVFPVSLYSMYACILVFYVSVFCVFPASCVFPVSCVSWIGYVTLVDHETSLYVLNPGYKHWTWPYVHPFQHAYSVAAHTQIFCLPSILRGNYQHSGMRWGGGIIVRIRTSTVKNFLP